MGYQTFLRIKVILVYSFDRHNDTKLLIFAITSRNLISVQESSFLQFGTCKRFEGSLKVVILIKVY